MEAGVKMQDKDKWYGDADKYWSEADASVQGMLQGFESISDVDIKVRIFKFLKPSFRLIFFSV